MLLWGTHHKSLQQTHVYSRSNVSMHLLTAWDQPLACYIPAKHENNLCRRLQIGAKTGVLFRKALNHLFSSCSTQKVFKDMNFSSSLYMCCILTCPKHYSTVCIFSGLYTCTFPATLQTYCKMFSKLLFKGRRKWWNKGCLLSALDYIAHFHLWVPRGYLAVPYTCQYVSLHKPSLLLCNNHQLSQTADLLTKQTLLNIAMCKCTTIFLIAKNMSFLHSIASRRDC